MDTQPSKSPSIGKVTTHRFMLLSQCEKGDRKYRRTLNRLVTYNLGLVHKIVHKFPMKNATCSYDDLFQEGVAGLIHGIKKFDETRGYRLSTYVYRWIQAYVSRYFQNHGKTIRVPVHLADTTQKLRKEVEALTKQLGYTPTESECALCYFSFRISWVRRNN